MLLAFTVMRRDPMFERGNRLGKGKDMKRSLHRLSAAHLDKKPDGLHGDGNNLYLKVQDDGASRSWIVRYQRNGKATDMGLGSLGDLSLAQARRMAAEARSLLAMGHDPLQARRRAAASAARAMTFRQCAEAYIADHASSWRNAKHKAQWSSTLLTYAYPVIGNLPVASIDTALILKIVRPLWESKTETGSRVRGRIEAVLDWATAQHMRSGPNPAVWRGVLSAILPAKAKMAKVTHHAALPYAEIATFMDRLRRQEGIGAKALQFAILTAARTGEAIGARWEEIDTDKRLWSIPGSRMKAGREHRVPLSDEAMAIIEAMRKLRHADDGGFVFQGGKSSKPLSSMALLMTLRRMKRGDLTAHGFRSAFRDWAAETTPFPHEVCEQALSHAPESRVVAAYQRGDLLEKRRQLMVAWGAYCSRTTEGNVIPLLTQKAAEDAA
jgi:integrase